MLHLRIPPIVNPNIYGSQREFTGKEALIISLTKIALGISWLHLAELLGKIRECFVGEAWSHGLTTLPNVVQ
jgi:hypothetical protein